MTKPYERVAESGEPTEAQRNIASGFAGDYVTESTLLDDGRLRVYILEGDIIQRIAYVSPDGTTVTES